MAFSAANLRGDGAPPGRQTYRYDTLDVYTTVDDAGYINNTTHAQNIQKGDLMYVVHWATAIDTGTISMVSLLICTHVAGTGAATPGNVNFAQVTLGPTPAVSSSD